MQSKGSCLAAALAAGLFSSSAHGQLLASLDPVVISAARIEQPLADAIAHTSVITRTDIERSLAPDLLTLLAREPGIEIAQLGGLGSQTGIFLRGAETRHTLVLIDGMPLNNASFSLASLDQIMASQIERVEIVRGNVSSLYGSQAVGGVIHVFTRSGASGFGARASAGSRGTRDAAVDVAGATGGARFGLALSALDTDGFNALDQSRRPGTNSDRDGYRNRSASGQLRYSWSTDQVVGVRALRSRGKLQYDSEFGPATQADESTQTIEHVDLTARNRITANWVSHLTLGRLRDALDAKVTAFPYFVTSTGTQIAWQNEIDLSAGMKAVAAAERLRQSIDSDTTYAVSSRTVDTLRAGLLGTAGAHRWQLNARHDDYSDFGTADTAYVGYAFAASESLRLTLTVSNAFNAPTFNDLFFPFGGNPSLKPERTRSLEAGVSWRAAGSSVRLQLFRTRYRDLIGFDAAFNRVNIGRASVDGAELSFDTTMLGWQVRALATVQDAQDGQGQRLVRRARAFGNVQVARSAGPLDLVVNFRATGDRADRGGGAARLLSGYALLDVAARWRVQPGLLLTLRADNVFDRAYENAYGYRGTPRGAFAGVEWRT